MELTLNKALRLKNRITEKIGKLKRLVAMKNSYKEEIGTKYDTVALMADLVALTEYLVLLKTEIAKANVGVYIHLNMVSELKGLCSTLEGLDTTAGVVENRGYGRMEGDPTTYTMIASITEEEAAQSLANLKEKLDDLQDKIDSFNATTKISLPECPVPLV